MDVVFLGPPGAGKGTQAERFAAGRAIPHISTGEMLRAAVAAGTDVGRQAKEFMDSGTLVPDGLMAGVVRERIANPDCEPGFLLDGFPRTLAQAELLDGALDALGRSLDHVVMIEVDTEEVVRRLMGRGRADDNPDTIRTRIETYFKQTEPLVAYFRERGLLRAVDGIGGVDDVYARIEESVDGNEE